MESSPEVAFVLGTRPEIIKFSPLIRECESKDTEYVLIHTGQHYSPELTGVFFEQLSLPEPDYNLEVGSGSHGEQTGDMLRRIEIALRAEAPATVLVQGDTNSTLAGGLAASKLDPDLGHIEAGLRSFDREMPEEINRIVTDHLADYRYTPTETTAENLRAEGCAEETIHVTGNTVVDAVHQHRELAAKRSNVLERLELTGGDYLLMTVHRAENVDDPEQFVAILDGVERVAQELDTEVVYPIHPRSADRLEKVDWTAPDRIRLVEPQNYLDFLTLEEHSRLVLTDSGGIQEEACILAVPCVTLRDSTERPETVSVGANVLADGGPASITSAVLEMDQKQGDWENPYGDGKSASRILETVVGH